MALFRRKPDPIREREERLRSQLAAVEAQIQKLNAEVAQAATEPRLRSTAQPHAGPTPPGAGQPPLPSPGPSRSGNPFNRRTGQAHLNERGVAKYDLLGNLRRWWRGGRAGRSRNPQLVTYLAAGGIQGLPALRHEKRVARNRFLLLCAVTLVLLWGAFYYWMHNQP
ncbi:MAG: hypothetical protein H7A45_12120 [Verrucomicrobiales bacterium]|nr:hypothetical protein [Verrucomicrobiales bacterium]MCP5525893.1 hypothetical protein [Verrucomicrobiales bacterium]